MYQKVAKICVLYGGDVGRGEELGNIALLLIFLVLKNAFLKKRKINLEK